MWRLFRRHGPPSIRSRGQSLVELALILPIFLLLIAGAVDLGRLFYAYVAITNASKEGALFGASYPQCGTPNSTACQDPRNVTWHVRSEADGLVDAAGNKLTPTISCGPGGTTRGSLSSCQEGDTYRVGVSFDFRLITPILGSLFAHHLVLYSESDATVLNQAYNPMPGFSVTKEVKDPKSGAWVRTPTVDPKTGLPTNLQFHVGDTVWYLVTIQNTGATTLTGVAVNDDAVRNWPPSGCRNTGSIPVGGRYSCQYAVSPSKAQEDLQNTVTVAVADLSPVVDVATVDVLARPPELVIHKVVGLFRHGGFSDWGQDLSVHRSPTLDPTVWYRITVTNTGGSQATGLTVRDSDDSLSDCHGLPNKLDAGQTFTCYYARPLTRVGSDRNTLTVDSKQTGSERDSATVEVGVCKGSDLVVPNLVEDSSGNARSVAEARAIWRSAGFSQALVPSNGFDGRDVASQSPRDPFECAPPTTRETVTHQ